jgi:spore germination protein GerM
MAATIAVGGLFAAACGVNDGGGAERITPGLGLDDTVPTTDTPSTTTTVVAESTASTSPASSSTSTTIVQTEDVRLYFISGTQLAPTAIPLTRDPTLDQVMVALQLGPSVLGPAAQGLRTAVPASPPLNVRDNGNGTATVDLPANFFTTIQGVDQLRAIGQIVLTLTSQRGIGGVVFTTEGGPTTVILGNGEQSAKDQVVTRADYRALTVAEPQTTTTTSTTSTTVAAVPSIEPVPPATTVGG